MATQPGDSWRPLFARDSQISTQFDVLYEGIPDWLYGSIWRWLMDRAAEGGQAMIYRLERRLHITLGGQRDRRVGTQHTAPNQLIDRYMQARPADEQLMLLDAIVYDMQVRAGELADKGEGAKAEGLARSVAKFGAILSEGGSAWMAQADRPVWGLVRRVDETTAALAEEVTAPSTDASRKIRDAWNACYRHGPDPDAAYRFAVLAVEAAAIPHVLPAATSATLGTVVSHIRDTVVHWSVGGLNAKQVASGETLLSMLKSLWHNQERHARSDGTVVDVMQAEAEVAVSLAVVLVHWFTTGLVVKSE